MKVSIKEEQQNNTFKDIKKTFKVLVDDLEKQFKKNNYLYRDKYL